jgi:biopolymer transport protein ExbD
VFRPAASAPPEEQQEPPKMIQIDIYRGAILMNGNTVTIARLGNVLTKLGSLNTRQTVMIKCARDSRHEKLIQVLDRCTRAGLTNLSVVSMNQ